MDHILDYQLLVTSYLLRVIVEQLIAVFPRKDKELHIAIWPCPHSHGLQYPEEEGKLSKDRSAVRHLSYTGMSCNSIRRGAGKF